MIGFVKGSTIVAILLLSATFAYAGDLRPAPSGGGGITPAPQGSKDTAVQQVQNANNQTAAEAVSKEEEDRLRRLRPVK